MAKKVRQEQQSKKGKVKGTKPAVEQPVRKKTVKKSGRRGK